MKKREHTKTPFLLRLGCFSKIACIYKALHYQQRFQQFLLMILLLFAMLSVSISVSVFTRSDSIVARIDQMHATHTAIISDSPKGMYKFLDVIQKEEHCFDYYEKTSVFPYAPYPGSSIQGSFPLYIEGYVKSDANYPLLDGKPLEKLIGNEIAITQSYAKQLEDKGIQVLGHKEVIKDPSNGKTYSFVIASIMEYPNYNQGYIGQNDINKVDMFTIAKPAVAIGNYETIKKLEKADVSEVETKISNIEKEEKQATEDWQNRPLSEKFAHAVILGDSITTGFTVYDVLDTSKVVAEKGMHLEQTGDLIKTAAELKPEVLFLALGLNDISGTDGDTDAFIEKYKAVLANVREQMPDAVLYINCVLPVSAQKEEEEPVYAKIPDYNTALKALCDEEGITFIDNTEIVKDEYYEQDGEHMKSEYYPIWAEHMAEVAGI